MNTQPLRLRYHSPQMAEGMLRHRFDEYLGKAEVAIYSILAAMLTVTAFAAIATAGNILWDGFRHWTIAAQTLRVLNELLIVLMLVEILHTVRISIRSHVLVTEPFLVVGLIASIRRILVISLEMATLTKEGSWSSRGSQYFPGRDDRARLARVAGAHFDVLHYTLAALPACLERFRAGLNPT